MVTHSRVRRHWMIAAALVVAVPCTVSSGCTGSATPAAPAAATSATLSPSSDVKPDPSTPAVTDTVTAQPADSPTTPGPEYTGPNSVADGPRIGSYSVVLSGTVTDYSGDTFSIDRPATLIIEPTISENTNNGVNPVDVCLRSGNPITQPSAGAIAFGTNTSCLADSYAKGIDMAYATVSGSTVTIQPDGDLDAMGNNIFTVFANGMLTCRFLITAGTMSVTTAADGSVTGRIDFGDDGRAGECGRAAYSATVSN